jgi:hypothetical protein
MRKGKYNVEIGQSKQFLFASGKPSLAGLRLTFRAVTIAARVERDGRVIAMGTVVDMTAQRGSAAAPDSAEHLQMLEAEPGAVLFYKPITVRAE